MDLMHAQFNNGHLSLDEIKTVLASDFGQAWPTLQKKFVQDEQGLYYQFRLDIQIKKKVSYSKGRTGNLEGGSHMGNGIGVLDLELKRKAFAEKVNAFTQYPEEMRKDFCDYWLESNDSGTKMLYETKKTFEINRRLSRWQKNNIAGFGKSGKSEFPAYWDKELYYKLQSSDIPKFERYKQHLRDIGFEPVKFLEGQHKGVLKGWFKKQEEAA